MPCVGASSVRLRELSAVAWLNPSQVANLAARGQRHKGFELEAMAESSAASRFLRPTPVLC